ncbi:hypothetical protein F4604DRAFT_1913276 [Suillus subluteus]|nr:hypothetical protein F4604DRAFT_1913276 [Suillus subluteus]
MSATIVDVSSKLGEYMIKGWVLTDTTCPSPACRGVPLMRSPNNGSPVTHFCVNCNGPQQSTSTQSNSSSTDSSSTYESNSRPSTPPTELSSGLSSPTFAPPIDTEETIRRRQQSDQASAEIGKRLLKGWAMLGEECPNIRCYGVPLVRPPKGGEERDPRKSSPLLPASESSKLTINISKPTGNLANNSERLHASVPSISAITAHSPAQALKLSLDAMSQRLAQICETANQMDVASIASAADAINKVAQALFQVRQLGEY